jgi:hypothetical protein
MRQRRLRRRRTSGRAAALVAAVLLAVTAQGAATAVPRGPGAAADRAATEFASSFEAGDPRPDWRNTVETAPDGGKKADGVDGGYSTGIPGNVTDKVTDVRASGEYADAGETKENLVDGEATTKWLAFDRAPWLEFDLSEPVDVVRYALTSANDAPERDPADWTLKGSADGSGWITLDTRKDQVFEKRQQTREFSVDGAAAYRHFRLEITRNAGADATQLAETQFAGGDATPPAPADMRSLVDRGPSGSPTAKGNAGFTGTRALRYAGTHKPDGRAYSYNKVFDVNTAVTRDTLLSYRIFPSMTETDLSYPATHVSVDLAFTDGTYLSELPRAVDQHGARMSPQGQAASKTLYVNQWNHKESRIGAVAAGRTTTRGTNSSGSFSRGNNFPATAVPHGFNFWTPVTDAGSTSWLYEYHRAEQRARTCPRCRRSAEPRAEPVDGRPADVPGDAVRRGRGAGRDRTARALAFRHSNETARPYYYGVRFENGITAPRSRRPTTRRCCASPSRVRTRT